MSSCGGGIKQVLIVHIFACSGWRYIKPSWEKGSHFYRGLYVNPRAPQKYILKFYSNTVHIYIFFNWLSYICTYWGHVLLSVQCTRTYVLLFSFGQFSTSWKKGETGGQDSYNNSIWGVGLLRLGYGDILHAYSILYEYILPASPLYHTYTRQFIRTCSENITQSRKSPEAGPSWEQMRISELILRQFNF